MPEILAMKIKQRSCIGLTLWIGFYSGNASNGNQVEELHRTHILDGNSCRQCQQWKSNGKSCTGLTFWMGFHLGNGNQAEQRSCTGLTNWMRFHAGNVSLQWKSSREDAQDSQTRWDFMQAMSAMEIKQRSCTQLTVWMRFHVGNVNNGNQAKKLHRTHFLDRI